MEQVNEQIETPQVDLSDQDSQEPIDIGYVTPYEVDTAENFLEQVKRHVRYSLAKEWATLSNENMLMAVSLAVRDVLVERMLETERRYQKADAKRVYYLSMEFLVGRSLGNNLTNLNLYETCRLALESLGVDLEELREVERDAALGNGGLGRLAACFLDSLATLKMPGFGYGINYEYGLFRQEIKDGFQVEQPDAWRTRPSPWLIDRSDEAVIVPLYGQVTHAPDRSGHLRPVWTDCHHVIGVPSDMPIVGYGGHTVNFLRLYTAKATEEFDFQRFNEGDYMNAVAKKIETENISKVLYPSDAVDAGRELRLLQEYFFVACAIRDIVRRYQRQHATFDLFPDRVAIQLNDTHPTLAIVELMRLLMDENHLSWEKAWEITEATFGYTNHTLMPEALEKWSEDLLQKVLPRHVLIIHEINRRFLAQVARRWPTDPSRHDRMSIIEEHEGKKFVRMTNLAIVGSHAVNGVAELHSELVKTHLVPDFYELWPHKFSNKTNGVTPRRWLLKANPGLADLLTQTIGEGWVTNLEELRKIEAYADDPAFQQRFRSVKRVNKERLARVILETTGIHVDPASQFDVMVKRIHEYKRQLLMAMRVIHEYLSLVEDRVEPPVPRTFIFGGKAAPGYWAAKQIIKLINELAHIINNDPRVRGRIRVVFLPDYRVSLAEKIIPAADLSEQISTAGMEACGTSNMKFAMNGALTLCTYDGGNIEIAKEVGEENLFIFGHRTEELERMRREHSYNPWDYYHRSPAIRRVMDVFHTDKLFRRNAPMFHWIFNALLNQGDRYFLLADFESYLRASEQAGQEFLQREVWARKAILNVARIGKFSSDRTIREYAEDIWKIRPVE
ncbi:MAG: glycogen/starch/alpha-glucan phosphorylase [Candidatus Hydrogenedentota bacterium]|jgi:starch phosphorylase|nr:MAG: glycogen/starch/alpha-glucan phosphorylase [Candidatus Hydrogenedentota bacterium]GIX45042.1 MAG: alpha-1,4 glucan phosphorylase [Candidatus Sumerlaea sp.]